MLLNALQKRQMETQPMTEIRATLRGMMKAQCINRNRNDWKHTPLFFSNLLLSASFRPESGAFLKPKIKLIFTLQSTVFQTPFLNQQCNWQPQGHCSAPYTAEGSEEKWQGNCWWHSLWLLCATRVQTVIKRSFASPSTQRTSGIKIKWSWHLMDRNRCTVRLYSEWMCRMNKIKRSINAVVNYICSSSFSSFLSFGTISKDLL